MPVGVWVPVAVGASGCTVAGVVLAELGPAAMALQKVKGNLERMFDKNLNDLVRGIRNNKEGEGKYIAACLEEIKQELRQYNMSVKVCQCKEV